MEKQILDLQDEEELPKENSFWKLVGFCRLALSLYIVTTYIGLGMYTFGAEYSDPSHRLEDILSFLFYGLAYFLFVS